MIEAEDAVRLTLERSRAQHPEWPVARAATEAMRAVWGQGAYADFYRLLRFEGGAAPEEGTREA